MSGNFYRAFEERYRGSRELIRGRLEAYMPFLTPLAERYPGASTLDLGCGRGEWLELLAEQGFAARGVDLNEGMLAACRERGLNVETADALASLAAQADASLALVSAFHLVEHLPFDLVERLIAEARRVLLPGGLLIMETPNPENLVVGTRNFYLDPSHIKPIPPLLLDFLVDYADFPRHVVVRLRGAEASQQEHDLSLLTVLQGVSEDYSVVAQNGGDDALMAEFDEPFAARYGVSLEELAARFDHQNAGLLQLSRQAPAVDALQSELAALRTQAEEQRGLIDALAGSLHRIDVRTQQQSATFDEASNELWNHALPALSGRLQGVEARINDMHAASTQSEALEAELSQHVEQLEQRVTQQAEKLEQRIDRNRFDALEQRVITSDRRLAAIPEHHLRDTEFELARSREQLQQVQERVQQLEGNISALLQSSSWRITAPGRRVGSLTRRAVSAMREGRVKSGLRRRVVALLLGQPDTHATRGLRGWLHRTKDSTWARRIALPLLKRFPQLRTLLVRLMEGGAPATNDVILPDWDGLLPAEYLQMPPLTRKILLDLARASSSNNN